MMGMAMTVLERQWAAKLDQLRLDCLLQQGLVKDDDDPGYLRLPRHPEARWSPSLGKQVAGETAQQELDCSTLRVLHLVPRQVPR